MVVHIIGAGCAGAGLARCLKQRGIAAKLFDRHKTPAPNAYWISLEQPEYTRFLKATGTDESSFVKAISGRLVQSKDRQCLQVNRGKLEEYLRQGLDVSWESNLDSVQKAKGGSEHELKFSDGHSLQTPFFVGADGEHSELRKALAPRSELDILPYVAYHGSRKIDVEEYRRVFESHFDPNGSKWVEFNAREGIRLKVEVVFDENSADARPPLLRWTFSRAAHGNSDPLYRPTRDKKSAKDIPQELFQELENLKHLPQPFDSAFDPGKIRNDRILHWLQRTCLLDSQDLASLAAQRIVLIGAAAHAEPIIGGKGANAGLTDAVDLSEHIEQHGVDKLSEFYNKVMPRWSEGVAVSEKAITQMHAEQNDDSRL